MTVAEDTPPGAGFDYSEIEAAVLETARGRWFLREFASRNRAADTAAVLEAIGRLQDLVATPSARDPARTAERHPGDLRDRLELIQETAWALRAAGARPSLCDDLDRHASEALRSIERREGALGTLRTALRDLLPDETATGDAPTRAARPDMSERPRHDAPAVNPPLPPVQPSAALWRGEGPVPRTLAEIDAWSLRDKLRYFT